MQYRRGVVSIWSMFVFLTMPTLYLDGRLTGFATATKTCPAHKLYWRSLNWKRSLPVLKWTSESEYFLSFEFFLQTLYIYNYIIQSKSNHLTPSLRMRRGGGN